MRFLLPLVLALLAVPGLAAALPSPLPPSSRLVGESFALHPTTCGGSRVAILEGTREQDVWSLRLRFVFPENVVRACTFLTEQTYAGPLALAEGGCLQASDGKREWLCFEPMFLRVDPSVHVDVCYRIDPCAPMIHMQMRVAAL